MPKLFYLLLISLVFVQCSTTPKIAKRYTPDDKMVFDLIERLKKNPADAEAAALLPQLYKTAADTRRTMTSNDYNNLPAGDRLMEISKQLQVAQQMYNEIKAVPAASKAIPYPWNPSQKIAELKQKAAEEYYNEGVEFMNFNNRPYAQKAYDMFVKADNAYPGYKDVRNLMNQAQELATIKVVINSVNYYNNGWGYWGFNNDYLQYKIARDLNNSSYRNTRFYTKAEADMQRIRTDKVVELNFNDLFIGTVYNNNNTIRRSKQIEVGQTKSLPPKPVYQTVNATVYVTTRILQSRASLECRIYDRATGNNILFDRFPDNYTWKQESARYTGDKRALEPSDWNLINNPPTGSLPSRQELAQRLVDNCYNQLLNRIRNSVSF